MINERTSKLFQSNSNENSPIQSPYLILITESNKQQQKTTISFQYVNNPQSRYLTILSDLHYKINKQTKTDYMA